MSADGTVLGSGRAGGSNWEGVGLEGAVAAVAYAVELALGDSGCRREEITASAFALAGVDWPSDDRLFDARVAAIGLGGPPSSPTTPSRRCAPASTAPSDACRRRARGRCSRPQRGGGDRAHDGRGLRRAGRRGDIVERSIWACARMREASGPDTALAGTLCEALGVRDLDDLFESITRRGLVPGADLAPLVLEVAASGDEVAHGLLVEQGRSLADEVMGVARRLRMLDTSFELVIAGSVHLAGCAPLDGAFTARVAEDAPRARIVPLRERAVIGAGRLAIDLLQGRP